MSVKFGFTILIYIEVTCSEIEQVEERWLHMKFDAAIKEDRADVPNPNKEDKYRFKLELSIGHILTAFRPVL